MLVCSQRAARTPEGDAALMIVRCRQRDWLLCQSCQRRTLQQERLELPLLPHQLARGADGSAKQSWPCRLLRLRLHQVIFFFFSNLASCVYGIMAGPAKQSWPLQLLLSLLCHIWPYHSQA